jgi:hypothetical protein
MGGALAVIGAVCALSGTAHAGSFAGSTLDADDVAWFYNRPGVAMPVYEADHKACDGVAVSMTSNSTMVISANPLAALVGNLVVAGIEASQRAGKIRGYLDDCMVVKGYRRYVVVGRPLKALEDELAALGDKGLAEYIAAETPKAGLLARQWTNAYVLESAR